MSFTPSPVTWQVDMYGNALHKWTNPESPSYLQYADYQSFQSLKGFLRDTF